MKLTQFFTNGEKTTEYNYGCLCRWWRRLANQSIKRYGYQVGSAAVYYKKVTRYFSS